MDKTAKLMLALSNASPSLLAMLADPNLPQAGLPESLSNLSRPEVAEAVKLFSEAVALSKVLGEILGA